MTVTSEYLKEHFDELIPAKDGQQIDVQREDEATFRLTLVADPKLQKKNTLWGCAVGEMWFADDWDSPEVNKEIEDSFYASELE